MKSAAFLFLGTGCVQRIHLGVLRDLHSSRHLRDLPLLDFLHDALRQVVEGSLHFLVIGRADLKELYSFLLGELLTLLFAHLPFRF